MKKVRFFPIYAFLLAGSFICPAQTNQTNNKSFWEFIKTSFLSEHYTVSTFKNDIRMQLSGNYTYEDSLFVANLVVELKEIINSVNVYLVSNNGNLVFSINVDTTRTKVFAEGIKHGGEFSLSETDGAVGKVSVRLNFESFVSQQRRNQVIQYDLIRSLIPFCRFYHNTFYEVNGINAGGILSQTDYEKVSFNSFDKEVISTLYSANFYNQFIKRFPIVYLPYAQRNAFNRIIPTSTLPFQIAILLMIFYGLLILKFWNFKKSKDNWLKYCLNALILTFPLFFMALAGIIYMDSASGLIFPKLLSVIAFFSTLIIGFLPANLAYLIERIFLPKTKFKLSKYFVQFIITLSTGLLALYILVKLYNYAGSYINPVIVYVFLIASVRVGLNFLYDKSYLEMKVKDLQLIKMEELKSKAELRAIQSRINPHFMFNALSSIQNLMNKNDIEGANHYLGKFSELTRKVLDSSNADQISMDDELKILEDYLQMEQLRFGFMYEIKTGENINTSNIEIPAMLLQPFVENAVKHGVSALNKDGNIRILASRVQNDIILQVEDNGAGFNEESINGNSKGIKLVKERIALLNQSFGGETLELKINSGKNGTTIILKLENWV